MQQTDHFIVILLLLRYWCIDDWWMMQLDNIRSCKICIQQCQLHCPLHNYITVLLHHPALMSGDPKPLERKCKDLKQWKQTNNANNNTKQWIRTFQVLQCPSALRSLSVLAACTLYCDYKRQKRYHTAVFCKRSYQSYFYYQMMSKSKILWKQLVYT